MSALLRDPTGLPGFSGTFHTNGSRHSLRSVRNNNGFFTPLASLIRKPAVVLERLIEDFRPPQLDSSIGYKDIENRIKILHLSIRSASTLQEWRAAATELDVLEGNNPWKYELESLEYDFALVESRLAQLEDARTACDAPRMLFLIRTSLTRYLGDMGNIRLYKHSHIGTKALIDQYIASALETLSSLLEITHRHKDTGMDPRHLLEQVLAARQSFGRSALLLSGGGTFGMNHIGVIKCLWEQTLLPRIISGSSAGSIVSAVLCTRTDEEVPQFLKEFCYGDLEVFHKEGEAPSFLKQTTRFLKFGSLFDISNLVRVMKELLGDITFQEAYNRTRRILNICVSSANIFELPTLLNYVTAPNVIIWSAVAASCSVPFIFSPASLLVKDLKTSTTLPWNPSTSQQWVDGSVNGDLPMTRLAEMFNVNHFIVSQVNPHVIPFLAKEEEIMALEARQSEFTAVHASLPGPGWLHTLAGLARDEMMHRMLVLSELGILPNLLTKTRSVLSQHYSGDITILPEIPYAQFPNVLKNPTTEFMLQAMLSGERATWPKLTRIQNHCAIELALDDAVQQLRARIAFSPREIELRLSSMVRPRPRATSDSGKRSHGRTQRKRVKLSGRSELVVGRSISDRHRAHMSLPRLWTHVSTSRAVFDRLSSHSPKDTRKASASFNLTWKTPGSDEASSEEEEERKSSLPTSLSPSEDSGSDDDPRTRWDFRDSHRVEVPHPSIPWHSTPQLFSYATQPSTPHRRTVRPAAHSGSSPMLPFASTVLAPLTSRITASPTSLSTGRTPLLVDDLPTYRSHMLASHSHSAGRDRSRKSRPTSGTSTPLSSDVHVSGAKAPLFKKNRSLSTGIRGLKPPEHAR